MANLEDMLTELRSRAEWFEIKPHWSGGGGTDGWALTTRSFNNLFEVNSVIIGDTVTEVVQRALTALGEAPVSAVQPRKRPSAVKTAPTPATAPKRLLRKPS